MANAISCVLGVRFIEGIGTQIMMDTYLYGADVPGGSVSCPCEVTVLPGDTAGTLTTKMTNVIIEDARTLYGLTIDTKGVILPAFTKGG